jgi:formylglycine-generating enzyme required for sulfatase activity
MKNRFSGAAWVTPVTVCAAFLGMGAEVVRAGFTVSGVTARQRPQSLLVDIGYDLALKDVSSARVMLEVSQDPCELWQVPVTSVTGDIGPEMKAGTGKKIVWDAGSDWPRRNNPQMRFRISVDDGSGEPTRPTGFSLIPAGFFTMGRTSGDTDTDAPPVSVHVSSFLCQQRETTLAQWREVRTWASANGFTDLPPETGKGLTHPMVGVTWHQAIKWCNARSLREGLVPVYYTNPAHLPVHVYRVGTASAITVCWGVNGYRLPTEAEWEKAARGGSAGTRFPWGDIAYHIKLNYFASDTRIGGYDGSAPRGYHPAYATGLTPYTAPVGSFEANGFGLFDVAGNVAEWCWDWDSNFSYKNGASDPRGPLNGEFRVSRGGSWSEPVPVARLGARSGRVPTVAGESTGFRPVRLWPRPGSVEIGSVAVDTRSVPLLGLPSLGAIGGTGAWLGGAVTGDGGDAVTEYGVVAALRVINPEPAIGGAGVRQVTGTGSQQGYSLWVNELAPGRSHVFRAYARNAKGIGYSAPLTFSTTGQNAGQAWRMRHFGTTADAGEAAGGADPDADGLSNAAEFALELDPRKASAVRAELNRSAGRLELAYYRGSAAQRDGTTVQAEWSDDLVQWSRSGVEETQQSDDGTHQLVTASVDAGTGGRRYVRLRVVVPAE